MAWKPVWHWKIDAENFGEHYLGEGVGEEDKSGGIRDDDFGPGGHAVPGEKEFRRVIREAEPYLVIRPGGKPPVLYCRWRLADPATGEIKPGSGAVALWRVRQDEDGGPVFWEDWHTDNPAWRAATRIPGEGSTA